MAHGFDVVPEMRHWWALLFIAGCLLAYALDKVRRAESQAVRIVALVDGECVLCNNFVQWSAARDANKRVSYCTLQSDGGQAILGRHGLPTDLGTVVVVEMGAHDEELRAHTHSGAVLRLVCRLDTPLKYVALLLLVAVPWCLRDTGYVAVAKCRYRMFGRNESCTLPARALKAHIRGQTLV